jgi:hypothetical protein
MTVGNKARLDTGPILEATAVLLTNVEWRQRVVERVVPLSPDHYELRRSYQFEVPPDLIQGADVGDELEVLLPVCWMAKHALLDFDITNEAGAPLHVLERRSIAGALSQILDAWKEDIAGLKGVILPPGRLESVCVASLDPWETARHRGLDRGVTELDSLCDYLNQLLPYRVAPIDVDDHFRAGRELSSQLYSTIVRDSSDRDSDSSLTVGAILAPYLEPLPNDATELKNVIAAHQSAIGDVIAIANADPEALGWLTLAAESGVRWPLLVRTRVAVGRPFLIKLREVRESGRPDDPKVFVHRADLNAARSYHLQVQSPDHAVWIPAAPTANTADGETRGAFDLFENSDLTHELFATYTSLDPRPDWVNVEIRFSLRWQNAIGYWYALALVIGALVAAFSVRVDVSLAALFTIPTTIVSAFLLARDAPLTARYLNKWRLALAILSVALWLIAGAKAIMNYSG